MSGRDGCRLIKTRMRIVVVVAVAFVVHTGVNLDTSLLYYCCHRNIRVYQEGWCGIVRPLCQARVVCAGRKVFHNATS